MNTLLVLLILIFFGVAVMVVVGKRFAKPIDSQKMARLQRWLMPLVGLMLVLSVVEFYIR